MRFLHFTQVGEEDEEVHKTEITLKEQSVAFKETHNFLLGSQQKKEAKARAKKRLEEVEKQVNIARSNYLQLGGKLEDMINEEN